MEYSCTTIEPLTQETHLDCIWQVNTPIARLPLDYAVRYASSLGKDTEFSVSAESIQAKKIIHPVCYH